SLGHTLAFWIKVDEQLQCINGAGCIGLIQGIDRRIQVIAISCHKPALLSTLTCRISIGKSFKMVTCRSIVLQVIVRVSIIVIQILSLGLPAIALYQGFKKLERLAVLLFII